MTTFVQSESSSPTARDLLKLLQTLSDEDLDKPVGTYDGEYEEYDNWQGRIDIIDDRVCLSWEVSEAIKALWKEQREQAAEALRLEQLNDPDFISHSEEVDKARAEGLLPPGY